MYRKLRLNLFFTTLLLSIVSLSIMAILSWVSEKMTYSPLERMENVVVDLGYKARSFNQDFNNVSKDDIIIVTIDNESIEKLGRVQWWPRKFDAQVISNISLGNPRAIGIDFLYTESDTLPFVYRQLLTEKGVENPEKIISAISTDNELEKAIEAAENVYLSFYDDHEKNQSNINYCGSHLLCFDLGLDSYPEFYQLQYPVLPVEEIGQAARSVGAIEMPSEKDGIIRKYLLFQNYESAGKNRLVANFPFYMWLDAMGWDTNALSLKDNNLYSSDRKLFQINKNGTVWINWLGTEEEFRHISFHKVLSGIIPPEVFADKYVFIGAEASGLSDMKSVPYQDGQIPGVDVHANAFLNLMNTKPVEKLSSTKSWMIIFLAIFSLIYAFMYLRSFQSLALTSLFLIAVFSGYLLLYFPSTSKIFPVTALMLTALLSFVLTVVYRYFTEEREKRQLRHAFSRYVSSTVVDKIIKDPESLKLGGTKRILTVLFSDIKGFTSYSEKLDPQMLVSILNRYLDSMSEPILNYYGTIDKFIGDAIFAIFGAPLDTDDHADQACKVALEMVERLAVLNTELESEKLPPLEIGIGINTGEMTVGNVGSSKRFDYTAIGDSVNLGSRIEGLTRYYHCMILISGSTWEACTQEEFLVRKLAKVKVYGKGKNVLIYQLIDYATKRDQYEPWLSEWENGISSFENLDFTTALKSFIECNNLMANDPLTKEYINRCQKFEIEPESFNDVIDMDYK